MFVTVFRSRLRPGCDIDRLIEIGTRMAELATAMPGFISYKDFAAEDGENVTIVEFADEASLLAWRRHPEHLAAQEAARTEFFSEYQIQVCRPERAYRYTVDGGRAEMPVF